MNKYYVVRDHVNHGVAYIKLHHDSETKEANLNSLFNNSPSVDKTLFEELLRMNGLKAIQDIELNQQLKVEECDAFSPNLGEHCYDWSEEKLLLHRFVDTEEVEGSITDFEKVKEYSEEEREYCIGEDAYAELRPFFEK